MDDWLDNERSVCCIAMSSRRRGPQEGESSSGTAQSDMRRKATAVEEREKCCSGLVPN